MMQQLWNFLVRIGFIEPQSVYYISGADILPPPLKGKQEEQALENLENGDESARDLLVEHNLHFLSSPMPAPPACPLVAAAKYPRH